MDGMMVNIDDEIKCFENKVGNFLKDIYVKFFFW